MTAKNSQLLIIEPQMPPAVQVGGEMSPVSSELFSAAHTVRLARSVMTDEQHARFRANKAADFEINRGDLGRFYVRTASLGGGVKMSVTPIVAA